MTFTPAGLVAALRAVADDPAVPDILRLEAGSGRPLHPADLDRATLLAALSAAIRERGKEPPTRVDDVAALLARLDHKRGGSS
jgi:hypothetical protein